MASTTAITSLLLLISIIHVQAWPGPIKEDSTVTITLRQPPSPGLGTNTGFSKCGGTGQVDDWRAQGCSGWVSPCVVPVDVPVPAELDFVSGATASQLHFQYYIYDKFDTGSEDTTTPLIDQDIADSAVEKGVAYTLHRVGQVPSKFQGKMITVKIILNNIPDNSTNICATANYQVESN